MVVLHGRCFSYGNGVGGACGVPACWIVAAGEGVACGGGDGGSVGCAVAVKAGVTVGSTGLLVGVATAAAVRVGVAVAGTAGTVGIGVEVAVTDVGTTRVGGMAVGATGVRGT